MSVDTKRWGRGDALWEAWQERAALSWLQEKRFFARCLWRLGYIHALFCFPKNDPRLAVSMANAALLARLAGREALAQRRISSALAIWSEVPEWIARMHIARRARTSLYHLRLELQHWSTYEANLRRRMENFATETEASFHAIAAAEPLPYRHFSRWKGEKPAFYDDSRKLLGACLLLADVVLQGDSGDL